MMFFAIQVSFRFQAIAPRARMGARAARQPNDERRADEPTIAGKRTALPVRSPLSTRLQFAADGGHGAKAPLPTLQLRHPAAALISVGGVLRSNLARSSPAAAGRPAKRRSASAIL